MHLDRDADPARDPTLLLRRRHRGGPPAAPHRPEPLDRLAAETPPWPDPWPAGASDDLVALLLEGHAAIPVLESLDQRGLIDPRAPRVGAGPEPAPSATPTTASPSTGTCGRRPPTPPTWPTASARPDLLVLGALLHDIGKGYPGDHTDVGIELVERIGPRMGFRPADVGVLAALVRHHLLLPDVATRRDLSDDGTISAWRPRSARRWSSTLLDALTEADSLATGPSAWGSWKAELVARAGRPGRPRPRRWRR